MDQEGHASAIEYFVVVRGARERIIRTSDTFVDVVGLVNGDSYEFTVYAATENGRSRPLGPVRAAPITGTEGVVAGLIVDFVDVTESKLSRGDIPGSERISEVDLALGEKVTDDAVLIELSESVDLSTAERLARELAKDDKVEWAEPDQFFFTSQDAPLAQSVSIPSDARYASDQWNLWDEYGVSVGDTSASMTNAWVHSRGDGMNVAVIDTGITPHPELDTQLVPGYDFVSNPDQLAATRQPGGELVPFDGDYVNEASFGSLGRDANPADPGDWRAAAPSRDSSWHGTKIAGTIAASSNGDGITGVAPKARIQPIRALSWRGGLLSDIAAAISWSSGGAIDGVPENMTPSRVINLSFAVQTTCPTTLQQAIDGAIQRGSVVVAAAGNAGVDASTFAPGNCNGVLTVASTNRGGNRAEYSNHGSTIDIAAPGGDDRQPITVASNSGGRLPSEPTLATESGTSIAAAHVSGAATLLLSKDPSMTVAALYERLTGRSFVKAFGNNTCDPENPDFVCGSGILALGFAEISSTTCTRTESTLVGSGANGTVVGRTYVLMRFATVGSCTWTPPRGVSSLDYLVVGGGGGGGSANRYGRAGGGGGGGEVAQGSGLSVTAGAPIAISVGAGGAGSRTSSAGGGLGGNSRLGDVQALGGGGGASVHTVQATAGFTGGGGAAPYSRNRTGAGVSPRKGGNGNTSTSISYVSAGGGAGAGGSGVNGTSSAGGRGGAGVASSITGSAVTYGGGGGGGKANQSGSAGAGTDGGASGGRNAVGANAVAGRGGGGGGAGVYTTSRTFVRAAGNGGSGLVVVRFEVPPPDDVRLDYDANGGEGAPSVQLETADSQVTVSGTTPTRAGYVFVAWNTEEDGSGSSYLPGAQFTMTWSDLTLFAQWAVLGQLITYDSNEGNDPPAEQIAARGESVTIAVQGSMSRTGYDFTGWNTQADGSGVSYSPGAAWTVSGDLVLYAQWQIRTTTVSYDANGGTSAPVSQSATFESDITLSSSGPTRSGYTFTGWNGAADGSGASYQGGASFTMQADNVTLYAQWAPNSQVLTYSANGGTGAPNSRISFAFASVSVAAQVPTRTGYSFAAWTTRIDGGGDTYQPRESFTMPPENLTLFAQWTALTYSIRYNDQGGAGGPADTTHDYGSVVSVPLTEPSRAGYTFNGWNTAANGSGVTWNPGATEVVTGDTTLYAQWIANIYTLRYNANGGSGPPDPASVSTSASVSVAATRPTRVGYSFTAWNTRRDGSGNSYASGTSLVMPGSDVTLFAQWSANSFSVTYKVNGGSGTPPATVSAGYLASTPIANPSAMSRAGFTFTGWNSETDGSGTSYSPGSRLLMPASNISLYAQWIANNYAVIFDASGGSGGPDTQSAEGGSSVSIPADEPERVGYTFDGWLDATGETLQPADTFTMPTSSAVLRAVWSIRSYTIDYANNGGTGAPTGSTEVFGTNLRVSADEPSRDGYTFSGWNTRANGSGTSYSSNASFSMPAENLTFFAQWVKVVAAQTAARPSGGQNAASPSSTVVPGLMCRATICAAIRKPLPVPKIPTPTGAATIVAEGPKELVLVFKPLLDASGIEIRGDDFGLVLKMPKPVLALDNDALVPQMALTEGSRVEAAGDGFLANSVVRGFIIPSGANISERTSRSTTVSIDLGEVDVDDRGEFAADWEIPWGVESGEYILQLNGLNAREEVRSLNFNVIIEAHSASRELEVASAAGMFRPGSSAVTAAGLRKIRALVNALPEDTAVVQVMVTGVALGQDLRAKNRKLALARSQALVSALEDSGISVSTVPVINRIATSTPAIQADASKFSALLTKKGKPLSTVTLVYLDR